MRDPLRPVGPPDEDDPKPPVWKRLGWFAVLAAGGLVAVAGTAYLLRAFLFFG